MKNTKLTRSLLAACSIVALSVVVYGCDSGPSQSEYDDLKATADANAEAAAAAQKAADDARAAAAAAAQAQADAEAATAAAEQARMDAEAKAAADVAAAEQAQMEAEAAQAEAERLQAVAEAAAEGEVEAAQAAAAAAVERAEAAAAKAAAAETAAMEARDDLAAAEEAKEAAEAAQAAAEQAQMEAEAARDAAIAARDALQGRSEQTAAERASADAKALLSVLMDATTNQEDTDDNGTPDTDVHTAPDPTLSVSREGMTETKVENVANAPGYTMSDMAPDMIEGWRGAMLTNAQGDTAVVYSDIGEDGTQSLLDRYESNRPTTTTPRSWDIDNDDTDDTGNTDADISWSDVMRPDNESTVSGGTVGAPILTFKGTVHGISGTFSCTGTSCVAPNRFTDGNVDTTGTSDGWTFVPDEGVSIFTDDTTYLTFGWWLSKGADGKPDDLTLISKASPGIGGLRSEASTAGTALRGSATYEGAAAGKFAVASPVADTYEGGHFTAMATLMVDFDANTAAAGATPNRSGISLSGTIDNFDTYDGKDRDDWSVALMADGDTGTADVMDPVDDLGSDLAAGTVALTTEWTTGGAVKGVGTWSAMFHGGDNDPTAGADINAAANTAHPMAVVGMFDAHIGAAGTGVAVARIQGAFGANKQ